MIAHRIVSAHDPRCQVAVFFEPDGSAQASVTPNNMEPTIIRVPKPPEGLRLVVRRTPEGCVDVLYEPIPPEAE